MFQETVGQSPHFTGDEFVEAIKTKQVPNQELSRVIRDTFTELFGDLSATTALCYVGDASNGDIKSFVARTDELFGTSASMVLSKIVSATMTAQ